MGLTASNKRGTSTSLDNSNIFESGDSFIDYYVRTNLASGRELVHIVFINDFVGHGHSGHKTGYFIMFHNNAAFGPFDRHDYTVKLKSSILRRRSRVA